MFSPGDLHDEKRAQRKRDVAKTLPVEEKKEAVVVKVEELDPIAVGEEIKDLLEEMEDVDS